MSDPITHAMSPAPAAAARSPEIPLLAALTVEFGNPDTSDISFAAAVNSWLRYRNDSETGPEWPVSGTTSVPAARFALLGDSIPGEEDEPSRAEQDPVDATHPSGVGHPDPEAGRENDETSISEQDPAEATDASDDHHAGEKAESEEDETLLSEQNPAEAIHTSSDGQPGPETEIEGNENLPDSGPDDAIGNTDRNLERRRGGHNRNRIGAAPEASGGNPEASGGNPEASGDEEPDVDETVMSAAFNPDSHILYHDYDCHIAENAVFLDTREGTEADSYYARLVGGEGYDQHIFGGGNGGAHTGRMTVDVEAGVVLNGYLVGGGRNAQVGSTEINVFDGASLGEYLIGGALNAGVTRKAVLNLYGGEVDNVVGGSLVNAPSTLASNWITELNIGRITVRNANSFIFGGGMASNVGSMSYVTEIVITIDGAQAGWVVGGGYAYIGSAYAGAMTMVVNSGEFSGYLYGGGRADNHGAASVSTVDMTLNGGTFRHVFGGGWAKYGGTSSVGQYVNITVNGGTFNGTIYGGGHCDEDGGLTEVVGDINITVNVSGANVVTFRSGSGITTGGCANSQAYGNTTLTLTGSGANLRTEDGAFQGWLNASGCGTAPSKAHTLHFNNYIDQAFQARIRGFNHLSYSGDTAVTVSSAIVWGMDLNYAFDLRGRDAALLSTAFMSQSAGGLGISEASSFTITLSYQELSRSGGDSGSFVLLDGIGPEFLSFANGSVSLIYYDQNNWMHAGYSKFGSVLEMGDAGLRISFEYDSGRLWLEWSTMTGPEGLFLQDDRSFSGMLA